MKTYPLKTIVGALFLKDVQDGVIRINAVDKVHPEHREYFRLESRSRKYLQVGLQNTEE